MAEFAKSYWVEVLQCLPRVDLVTCQLTRTAWKHYIESRDAELPLLVLRYLELLSEIDSPDAVEVNYYTKMLGVSCSLQFLDVSDASEWFSSFVRTVYIRQLAVKGDASPAAVFDTLLESGGLLKVDAIGIEKECIKLDLHKISQALSCFEFDQLQVASSSALFGPHIWRVPLIFVLETDESVYADLLPSMDGESVVPRCFFKLPVVRRLDSVHISPKIFDWSNSSYAIPPSLTAMLDFFSTALSSGKTTTFCPVEISLATYENLHPRCVEALIEWFQRNADISPPEVNICLMSDIYTASLNDIWRSAAENLHRLQPANSAIKVEDQQLLDKYVIRTQDARKDVIVDVYYNADRYKKKLTRMGLILPEIFADVLGYLERYDIDVCQAACGQLRDLVDSLVLKLPLHCIHAKFSSSFLEDDHIREINPMVADSEGLHTCSTQSKETVIVGHPSLPSGHYIECQPPFSCHIRQATMGAEITLLKRVSPYSCDFDVKMFTIRDVRFANGIVQSDGVAMQNVLRLTRNCVAFSVWLLSSRLDLCFVATGSFFDAWRLELERTDLCNKFVVDKLHVDLPAISAANATQVAHFLSDVVDVRQLISKCDLARYEPHFASDPVALSMWEKLSKQTALTFWQR